MREQYLGRNVLNGQFFGMVGRYRSGAPFEQLKD